MRAAVLALALTTSGCGSSACRQGTLFVDLSFVGAVQSADTLDVSVAVDGQPVGERIVHRASGASNGTIAVVFGAQYPTGRAITLTVTALALGAPLTTTVDNFTAARGCTARSLTLAEAADDLAAPSAIDIASVDDLASSPIDLAKPTIDLATPTPMDMALFTIGQTNVLTGDDSGNGNVIDAQKATLARTATILSLSFYVNQAAGSLVLGIYDASGATGGPGVLKAQTNTFTPTTGWNTQNVITPVSLAAGTYWLAYLPSSSSLHFPLDSSSGTYFDVGFTFAALPSSWPSGGGSGTSQWSFYATLQ